MSVTITLDSRVLSRRIAGLPVISSIAFDPVLLSVDYIDGWLKVKATTAGYPRVDSEKKPVGALASPQATGWKGFYYLPSPTAIYLFFLERATGDATSYYIGFYWNGSTLYARSYPGTLSGTTSGALSPPAIVLLELSVGNVNGTIYATFGAWRYDWDTDTATNIVNAVANVGSATGLPAYWYQSLLEFNAATGVVGIATPRPPEGHGRWDSAPTGAGDGSHSINHFKLLKSLGLRDPRTIDWS